MSSPATTDTAETSQYVEAATEATLALVFVFWAAISGGLIQLFTGRKPTNFSMRHRYTLLVLAAGALSISLSIFVLTQRGGTFVRSDGVSSEYVRQIGLGFAVGSLVVAFGQYAQFQMASQYLSAFFVFLAYLCATLVTLSGDSDFYWIFFAYWFAAVVAGAYTTFVSQRIKAVAFYANIIIWFFIWLHVVLYGLWLILSVQIADVIDRSTEAILYLVFDVFIFLSSGVLIGVTFTMTQPLFLSKAQMEAMKMNMMKKKNMRGSPLPPDQYRYGGPKRM